MRQVVIESPVMNSPFEDPRGHFRLTDKGITNQIPEKQRPSAYFIPIARPKKKGKQDQLSFDAEWTQDRVKENDEMNRIRGRMEMWRQGKAVYLSYKEFRKLWKSSGQLFPIAAY